MLQALRKRRATVVAKGLRPSAAAAGRAGRAGRRSRKRLRHTSRRDARHNKPCAGEPILVAVSFYVKRSPPEKMNLPNQLTVGRLGLTAAFVAVTSIHYSRQATVAVILFAVAGLTDWLDGWLARRRNLITDFGKLMDPLADKMLVTAALLYLLQIGKIPLWMAVVMVSREFLITGLRLIAASKGVVISADRAGKHKTISQLVAILVALSCISAGELGFRGAWLDICGIATGWLFAWATLITVASGAWYFWKNRGFVVDASVHEPSG